MVNQWQRMFYNGHCAESLIGDNPDLTAVSASMGVPGTAVHKPEELAKAVEALFKTEGPALLDVFIPADENVYPMVPAASAWTRWYWEVKGNDETTYRHSLRQQTGRTDHVSGLISRRAINIECINAGYTEEADVTRINIVVSVENRWELDQAVNQLAKLIDVIKVVNLDDAPFVSYELAMIKVKSPTPQTREELTNIAQLFNAKIVDVQRRSLVLRLTGREDHIEALLEMLKDYDIIEIARTGQISLSRGEEAVKDM